jgi:hypothetical protein
VPVAGPLAEQVAEQHDVADRPGLGQRHAVAGVVREGAVADEPRRAGVADEEGRDGELQLVGQVAGQELGVDLAAALHHQAADPARGQVVEDGMEVQGLPRVDDGGEPAQALAQGGGRGRGGVDELLAGALREEAERGIEGAARDGDLDRALRQAPPDPLSAPRLRPDGQPRVVTAEGVGSDQDGVAASPLGVDAVQVGCVGEHQPSRTGVVDAPVDGHRAAQKHVGPRHRLASFRYVCRQTYV